MFAVGLCRGPIWEYPCTRSGAVQHEKQGFVRGFRDGAMKLLVEAPPENERPRARHVGDAWSIAAMSADVALTAACTATCTT